MSHPRSSMFKPIRSILMTLAVFAIVVAPAVAQVTGGGISGRVTASEDGTALPGVTVEAIHVPTGTRYNVVSGDAGRYTIQNVRVGGPYTITANLDGFRPAEQRGVQVRLGETIEVPLTLGLAALAETIEVTASAEQIIDPNRTGSSTAVSTEQIESLPTVNRSLQDFARTNPYFNVDPGDSSSTRLSVAGRNNRYNTIQIDGAVNNDLFGLADTGTPGGQTDSQPISLDAIEQIQMVVSPYDVRQGGFTGGGINAVTRSGSNDWDGSLFYSQRNEEFVGDGPFDDPISNFDQDQYGGRIGGPILRDRLFFFLSGEINRRENPTGISADGSGGDQYRGEGTGTLPSASLFRDYLISNFQYDPGSLGDFPVTTDSDLALVKFDWNANPTNQVTLRHNYVDAARDVVSDRSSSRFRFPSAIYAIADETNSTVVQVNSIFGSSAFNEARVGFQTIRDVRDTPVIFPTVEVGGTGPRSGALHAGTERFSGANALDQDVLEITNDFTFITGNHTVTAGTHNEIFEFKNLFLSEAYGYYYFNTLEDFFNDNIREYRVSFANGSDPRRPTQFEVAQYGLYVSDQWRVNNNLSLTIGLRGDKPDYKDTPSFNAEVQDSIGFSTAETPSDDVVFSPRVGFNWDPTGEGRQQVRGGVGVFAGRTPYVWISNAYGNTGVENTALFCSGSCAGGLDFNPDPFNQPRSGAAGSSFSVDLIDPDFELPRVLRATLGYDRELPFGIRGTIEGIWSQTQEDVYYQNVNRVRDGVAALDGRPTYDRIVSNIADAILLTNTSKGEELMGSILLSRPFGNRATVTASYAYQDAESAFDGTSSRAISNWQFHHTKGDIFTPEVSRSPFEVEHRFNTAITYNIPTGPLNHTIGLYYNAQSGRPYSLMLGGDINQDGYSTNDLLFVPNSLILCPNTARTPTATAPCGVNGGTTVTPLDAAQFSAFLASAGVDDSGRILDRYELNEPWARQLDLHYELGLPRIADIGTQITVDILNLANMVDEDYGVVEFVSNQNYTPVVFQGIDASSGLPIYRENFNGSTNPGRQFSTADLRSRWQARLGVRVNF